MNSLFNNNIIEERMTNNEVKLSILADIGSSSFVYDMHNIKEVFIFPKIWYRRSLARRLFFGDETIPAYQNANGDTTTTTTNPVNLNSESKNSSSTDLSDIKRPKTLPICIDESQQIVNASNKWQTLVLISINLVDLEVKMNIGSVMGNVCLLAKNAKAKSKIFVTNFGKKFMQFNFVLDNSRLIAEGGSNGCLLRLQDITSSVEINDRNDDTGCPSHKIEFGIDATECRIDSAYNQATPILAFRLSSLNLKINDSWEPILTMSPDAGYYKKRRLF